jgi:F-type H+-transporting ATPase subunit b
MDDRDDQIKTDMDNAKSNGADVDGMLEEAKKIIAQAKKEALSIREKAKNEAILTADAKVADAKVKAEQKYNEFVQTLAQEKSALESSLVSQMPLFKDSLKAKLSSI